MNEREWQEATETYRMFEYLAGKVSHRKWRLFACACVRLVWPLLPDGCRRAVEVAERLADGDAAPGEFESAWDAAEMAVEPYRRRYEEYRNLIHPLLRNEPPQPTDGQDLRAWWEAQDRYHEEVVLPQLTERGYADGPPDVAKRTAAGAALALLRMHDSTTLESDAATVAGGVTETLKVGPYEVWTDNVKAMVCRQCNLLRHLFNPFEKHRSEVWPATAITLAEALYAGEPCGFALHDALLEAGHLALAEHFQAEPCHPKGCWALDRILGKS